jgi:hypothetical protein
VVGDAQHRAVAGLATKIMTAELEPSAETVFYLSSFVSVTFGAGDGNRTHVRSLGSFYTAIVRRPLTLQLIDYTPTKRLVLRGPYFPYFPKLGKTLSFGKY